MLNIEAIRKTQASIADESKPFDMAGWTHCIAGHACQVKGHSYSDGTTAAYYLGLSEGKASMLFTGACTRAEAIAKLEALITDERACMALTCLPEPDPEPEPLPISEPEPELVCA